MTTLQYISELETLVGAVTTSNSRWNRRKLIALLNSARAIGISNTVQGGTRLHPDWQQPLTIPYNEDNQDSECFASYNCPSVISLKKLLDGFIFVGNEKMSVAYTRINTRGEYIDAKNHPMLARAFTQGVAALYEDGQWKLFCDKTPAKIESLGVVAIFNDPTEVPHFNIEEDKYPLDEKTWDWVKGYVKQGNLNQIEGTPIQTEHTSRDTFGVKSSRR